MSVTNGQGQSPWTTYSNQSEAARSVNPPASKRERKILALRNLAERPGTPEEGKTAKRFLEKFLNGVLGGDSD